MWEGLPSPDWLYVEAIDCKEKSALGSASYRKGRLGGQRG